MNQHDLVSMVKNLAIELGRSPTRKEFEAVPGITQYKIYALFKNYSVLLKAAGLEAYSERGTIGSRKIDNSIFEKDIEEHINSFDPTPVIQTKPYPSIAVISDIHWPFQSDRVLSRFMEYVGDAKPDHVILNGDAWDRYSHGRFPRSHNIFTPREEDAMSRRLNEEFWQAVKKSSPLSDCTQMLGNHEIRPMKQILSTYPQAEDWIAEAMKRDFTFTGVKTIFDHREELMINDICVHHGYRSQLGAHRDYTLYNSITGHTHKGGVVYRRIRGQTLWELNSGLAGDPEAKGLTYTPQKITNWTPGFGACDRMGPRFIPV